MIEEVKAMSDHEQENLVEEEAKELNAAADLESAELTDDDLEKVAGGYERALRAQIPG